MLEQLSTLARVISSDKRRELMRKVSDLFVEDAEKFNDVELFLFGEILTKLLDDVDIPSQVHLSKSIAPIPQTPHDLAMELACREAEVAAPILEQSEVLTVEDLVEIATTKSIDHRIAISHRPSLTAAVTDALIAPGEQRVLLSVCENQKAEISKGGFDALVEIAEKDSTLCKMLSYRSDMPVDVVKKIMRLMPEKSQEKLAQFLQNDSESSLDELLSEAGQQSKVAVEETKWQNLQTQVLVDDIHSGKKELGPTLELLCSQNRPLDVGAVLASVAKLPEQQAVNAIMKRNGHALIILCRAIELSEETFNAIANMRTKRLKLAPSAADRLLKEFFEFEVSSAQRIMRFVSVRNMDSSAA